MTIDEAIQRYAYNAEYERTQNLQGCLEFKQLVKWLKELKQLRKQTRWIPCSERLPEDGQHVMVTFGCKIAFCLAQDNNGALTEITSLISKDANVLWLYPEDEWGDGYEAWMPLPEPYKAETEGEACKGCHYNDGEVHAECVLCDKAGNEERNEM